MDLLREFLEDLKRHGQAQGYFLGLLHLLIGRRITGPGSPKSAFSTASRHQSAMARSVAELLRSSRPSCSGVARSAIWSAIVPA